VVRIACAVLYGGAASLGVALAARPAALWLQGLGLFGPVLPSAVEVGWVYAILVLAIVACTLDVAVRLGLGRKPRVARHWALLLLVGAAFALRAATDMPRPPPDPSPQLLAAVRAAAAALDQEYASASRYSASEAVLRKALATLAGPGFVFRGRVLRLDVRVVLDAQGPRLEPLPGDLPGTVYVTVSRDRQRAWVSVLSLHRVLHPIVHSRAGTHSLPGGDTGLPAYPNAPARSG
jgi:hypothetical protein